MGPKIPHLAIFRLEFENNIVIFKISHPQICVVAKFCEIMKMPKFGAKNALFVYLWAKIVKHCCHIWNQHPQIYVIAKFSEKAKIPNFGTTNPLFRYFWPKMPYLCILGIEFEKKFCHIWNQRSQTCVVAKFGAKILWFGYIWSGIWK